MHGMTGDRRAFLARLLRTAAAGGAGATTLSILHRTRAADGPKPDRKTMPTSIIDTHQHLWDGTSLRLPWLEDAPEVLRQSHATREYLQAIEGLGIDRAVYMEVDADPDQQAEEAEQVLALCRNPGAPTVAAVIGGRPEEAGFGAHVERFAAHREIAGFRRVLHVDSTPPGFCLGERFTASVRGLGERDLSFDLCLRPRELGDGVRLAKACPGTRFILDHCGNADPKAFLPERLRGGEPPWHDVDGWKRDIDALAARENVVCKISGIVARVSNAGWDEEALAPIVAFCLDAFGPDRVVFGSDWPVCLLRATLSEWVHALAAIVADRPQGEQDRLWHANAERLYRLAGPAPEPKGAQAPEPSNPGG